MGPGSFGHRRSPDTSLRQAALIAGLGLLIMTLFAVGAIYVAFPKLIISGDATATASNIIADEARFRIGMGRLVVAAICDVVVAWALYVFIEPVSRHLALLALRFRFGEAIPGGGITVLAGLIPLLLLNRDAGLGTEHLHALVGLFLAVRTSGLDIVLIFVGVGGTLFCYLFYQSRYVPRVLAVWGVFTYLSMLAPACISMACPSPRR